MRWFTLAALMLAPLPSQAGPQDPWTIDPKASALSFSVAQVGSIVSGRFPTWTGELVLDPGSLATARIDIKIDTRPVSTNNRDVDSLMKGPNFLDVQKFPEARFVATSISGSGERYEARGKLTIRGVTRDVVLPFTLRLQGNQATARGSLQIKRLDYGIGRNEWASTNYVADAVSIEVTVLAARP
jgi:polyisoprenoid-binding protein YceI